ncbi:MAG: hypothetical protein NTW42_00760 [Deltaproteobacteria bacterium]|nr:hypothetical protein [Deltaproteobacteria bacterium]
MVMLLFSGGCQDFILDAETQGLPDGHCDISGCSEIGHTYDNGTKRYKIIVKSSLNSMKRRHHEQRRNSKIWVKPWNKRHGTQCCATCRHYYYIEESPPFII